jgi:hypothetical protein
VCEAANVAHPTYTLPLIGRARQHRLMNTTPPARPVEVEPGVTVHPGSDRRLATEHWLLSAHPSPGRARVEWHEHGVTAVRCGGLFSAVRLPGDLVQAAAASKRPDDIDDTLAELLSGGPVICDTRGPRYYALVPASVSRSWTDAVRDWQQAGIACLGVGTYLGVPRLDLVPSRPPRAVSYWSVPMESPGALCRPFAVARLIAYGMAQMTDGS